ncbi:hypothetical protein [Cyclobacterium qasimii]|uniref:HPt domain-containing protein n=2 Tax=Cyclobacterium qasimii TaxID=1350429 RepID=S7VQN9_9BACT|nr:hypothetical protein [Cyclobacterium qasimii]EPR71657.1 hypothetical protein ADICYQ_0128 [Cyclobacterium qasimii M12-11B]GEO22431.1 hypothetical protein CQA01_29650 [Cyclobacterium qasimii]
MYKQIKPDMIYHYFDQDIELIHEIIELVLELNVQDLKNLMPLYQDGEINQIKKKFHKSKPVFSLLGANNVNKNIVILENNINTEFSEKYPAFLEALNELEQDLHSFLKSSPH